MVNNTSHTGPSVKPPKLMLPGMAISELSPLVEQSFFGPGLLMLLFGICWRAQLVMVALSQSVSRQTIQSLPSVKFTASLIASNQWVRQLVAGVILVRTGKDDAGKAGSSCVFRRQRLRGEKSQRNHQHNR